MNELKLLPNIGSQESAERSDWGKVGERAKNNADCPPGGASAGIDEMPQAKVTTKRAEVRSGVSSLGFFAARASRMEGSAHVVRIN